MDHTHTHLLCLMIAIGFDRINIPPLLTLATFSFFVDVDDDLYWCLWIYLPHIHTHSFIYWKILILNFFFRTQTEKKIFFWSYQITIKRVFSLWSSSLLSYFAVTFWWWWWWPQTYIIHFNHFFFIYRWGRIISVYNQSVCVCVCFWWNTPLDKLMITMNVWGERNFFFFYFIFFHQN